MGSTRKSRSKPLSIEEMSNLRIMELARYIVDWQTGIVEFDAPSIQYYYKGIIDRYMRQLRRFMKSRNFYIIDKAEKKELLKGTKNGRS